MRKTFELITCEEFYHFISLELMGRGVDLLYGVNHRIAL